MSERIPWTSPAAWPSEAKSQRRVRLEADAATRAEIARRLGLEDVPALGAELELRPWFDGMEAEGRLTATVIRLCGVTLDPFVETLDETVVLRALPPGSPHVPAAEGGEIRVDPEGEDPPEVHGSEGVDLGGFLTECLGLALDPFPRKPDVVFEPPPTETPVSPFSVLAQLAGPKAAAR